VVSPEDDDLTWIPDFKSKQEANNFTALAASIDIITQEKVSGVGIDDTIILYLFIFLSHLFEHMKQIRVLTM